VEKKKVSLFPRGGGLSDSGGDIYSASCKKRGANEVGNWSNISGRRESLEEKNRVKKRPPLPKKQRSFHFGKKVVRNWPSGKGREGVGGTKRIFQGELGEKKNKHRVPSEKN